MIFDIHCHLGDILYPGGGEVVLARRPMAHPFDPDAVGRLLLYRSAALEGFLFRLPAARALMTRAERMRNFTATLANLSLRMDRHGVGRAAVMPIAPNVTFDDLLPAVRADARLVPFGSIDFTAPDLPGQARRQLSLGAAGFKLHPVLQRVEPDSPPVLEALSALPAGTAVLLHTGAAHYYPARDACLQAPENGGIPGTARLCRAFPSLRFVAAHGGLMQFRELVELLPALPNVAVDTSFVSPAGIRALLGAFGTRRVLFASDWPYGFHGTGLACVRAACRGAELERVLLRNAEELLSR